MEGCARRDFSMSTPRDEDPPPTPAAPVQPQSHDNPAPDATSAPALSAESIAPPAALNGALEATQQTVILATQPEASAAPSEAPEASTEPAKKGKGVGKRLTDRQRVEILELIDKSGGSLSNAEIARRYGITRAAIQKLKLKGAEVRARYRYGSAETRDGRKRGGHVMSVPFERELFEWVRGLKARKVPVPPSLVKEKAKLLVPKYGLGNFQASNGWYYNFCRRFNLTTGGLVEERDTLPGHPLDGDDRQPDNEAELAADQSPQLQQMEAMAQQAYEQQLQQYQQQMANTIAISFQQQQQQQQDQAGPEPQDQAEPQHQPQAEQPQHQEQQPTSVGGNPSKSDRMLALLEQQNALLERQNSMIEQQAEAIQKLFMVVTKGGTAL